jgi:hypothetical protein
LSGIQLWLAKVSLFCVREQAYLVPSSKRGGFEMKPFWVHLQRLALGQLFHGGYLRSEDATRAAAVAATAKSIERIDRNASRTRPQPTGRVVTCQ